MYTYAHEHVCLYICVLIYMCWFIIISLHMCIYIEAYINMSIIYIEREREKQRNIMLLEAKASLGV